MASADKLWNTTRKLGIKVTVYGTDTRKDKITNYPCLWLDYQTYVLEQIHAPTTSRDALSILIPARLTAHYLELAPPKRKDDHRRWWRRMRKASNSIYNMYMVAFGLLQATECNCV